jgi:ribosomal-protein-alanine N-acetyltransferase
LEVPELTVEICAGAYMLRLLDHKDAVQRARLLACNAAFLKPYMPEAALRHLAVEQQEAVLLRFEEESASGLRYPWGIFTAGGESFCGWVNLNNVVRGAFHSADVGYAMDKSLTGRGIMTEAVAAVVGMAFGSLGLHRIQAAIMPANTASRRVLESNGFESIGLSRQYLQINGQWEDHWLYARILEQTR